MESHKEQGNKALVRAFIQEFLTSMTLLPLTNITPLTR
jgi:hypothetical protein